MTSNIVDLLGERAARHPERTALTFVSDGEQVSERWSYAELDARARALAAQLNALAPAGSRALLLYPNGPAYVGALLACFYAGIVCVPAYPPRSAQPHHVERLLSIARDAAPSLLLTESLLVPVLEGVKSTLPALAGLRIVGTDTPPQASASDYVRPELSPEGLALLQYTSGSTATPKGVMVAHQNLLANQRAIDSAFQMTDDDVVVSWLPLFHDMGLIGTLLQPLYKGVSSVLMAPQQFMERPERWLRAVSRHRGSVSGGPDFAYRLCAERVDPGAIEGLDLSSWRLAFCGAEPVRYQTLRAFADRFAPAGFAPGALYPCYGLAEATLLVTGGLRGGGVRATSFAPEALAEHRAVPSESGTPLVACGQPQPEHELLIVDPETREPLEAGNIGEIFASGPSIAQGYWQNAEASEQTFVRRGSKVFLATGDLGFVHEGELFVTGRHKDMIIVRGQNLYPQDIERDIEEKVPVVRKGRTAAFSIELGGVERIAIAAEVNARTQKLIEPEAVCRAISERVAESHGEAAELVLLLNPGALPITSSGKLQRSACRSAWQSKTLDTFFVFERSRS
ncbi:MAG: fatty acyl-AMP ligase [Polyangiaceae bacterium]